LNFACPVSAKSLGTSFSGNLWIQYNYGSYSGLVSEVATVTAKISTLSSITPTSSITYVPITITNSQSESTPAPFQQMLKIDSASYSSYINSDWSNVEFTTGPGGSGSQIQAWVESSPSNTATDTIVWVKLPNGITAGSSTKIYMDFMSSNVMSSSGPTGEAPQLSPTYAEYDNGADVFSNYWNFAGTSLPSGWVGSGYIVDNGLTIPYSSYAITSTDYGLNSSQILDFYGQFSLATSDNNAGFGYTTSSSSVLSSSSIQEWFEINTYVWSNGYAGGLVDTTTKWSATTAMAIGYNVYSIYWPSASEVLFNINYGSPATLTTNIYSSTLPIGAASTQGSQATIGPFYWVRTRAYPPNGVMPSTSFGSVA